MPSVLRHRGIEAWLEDSNGRPIAFSEDAKVDSHTISTWVNVKPKQFYSLRWRTSAGRSPRSALCQVYVKDGFHSATSSDHDELESSEVVSTSIMDAARRVSQSKSTKGWLNPPYSRFGCLRIRRRIQTDCDSTKKLTTQPEILLLGSVQLEIRRVSGQIRNNQVYWGKGDDDDMGVCVFNPDGIKVIDDAEQDKPPYITFQFKFREDPKFTKMNQRIKEENEDTKVGIRVTRGLSKRSTLAVPAPEDITPSIGPGPSTHTSSLPLHHGKIPKSNKVAQRITENVDKIGWNHLKPTLSKSARLALPAAEGLPDVAPSIGPRMHASSLPLLRGEIPKITKVAPHKIEENVPVKIGRNHLKTMSSKSASGMLALPAAEDIPDDTPSAGSSAHTSLLPLIPRGEFVSNANLVAPDSRLDVQAAVVAPSQSKVGHPLSSPPSTTEMILSNESAMPIRKPSPAPMDRANSGMQIWRSDPLIPHGEFVSNANLVAPDSGLNVAVAASQSKIDHPPSSPPTITLSTESAMPTSKPSLAPMDRTATANHLCMQTGRSDGDSEIDGQLGHLGVLSLSDGMPSAFSHSRNSPGPVPTTCETDSHIQTPLTVCEPEMAPQIYEVQPIQQSSEGGDQALTASTCREIINAAPDISMASNLDLQVDDREPFGPDPAEVVLEKSSDIVELSTSTSRKGKRKMTDRDPGDDTNAHVPAGDGGLKRHRMTMVMEEDSDIQYIGSWSPRKTRTKNVRQTAVKLEHVSIKLENPVSESHPLSTAVKSQQVDIKIKFEDELDRKMPIDEMMGNYDALERRKEELKKKLAVKMEAQQREIDELLRRLGD